jgi:cytochrome c oxidase subunit II
MDKSELKVIIWTGLVLSLFLASLLYASTRRSINVPQCVPYSGAYSKPQVKKLDDNTYQIFYVARMWGFEPAEVTLPAGSEVDIFLSSADVVHGFHIEKKALNMMAVPGAVNMQTLKFTEPGIYKIVCHEYCGTGHQNMQGQIIINPGKQ